MASKYKKTYVTAGMFIGLVFLAIVAFTALGGASAHLLTKNAQANEAGEMDCINHGLRVVANAYGTADLESYNFIKLEESVRAPFADDNSFDRYDLDMKTSTGKYTKKYDIVCFIDRVSGRVMTSVYFIQEVELTKN